jgi:NAD(P)-dependent dehydrogenase (short-subunit alcohol dehydrogenase family)
VAFTSPRDLPTEPNHHSSPSKPHGRIQKAKIAYLHLDLAGLKGTKASVEEFLAIKERLDVLWNNAGVLTPLIEAITMQVCCMSIYLLWEHYTKLVAEYSYLLPYGQVFLL